MSCIVILKAFRLEVVILCNSKSGKQMNKNNFSRRNFLKTGAISSVAIAGVASITACENNSAKKKREPYPLFKGDNYSFKDGVTGLLFSQVGYELGMPIRIIVRLPKKNLLLENTNCVLTPSFNENEYKTTCKFWGKIWNSYWWVAEFPAIKEEGEWNIEIQNNTKTVLKDYGLKVKKNILWDSTIEWSSVDMLFRRRPFPGVGAGWQDAGALWAESPAQSAMIIALEELLENKKDFFDEDFLKRLYEEIIWGCNYLVLTQEKATELGFPKGAMSHDVLTHDKDILPHDVSKAILALLKAVRLLPDLYADQKKIYKRVAGESLDWLEKKAKPMGDYGFVKRQRGISEETEIPKDEWPTRDLILMCSVALELVKHGKKGAKDLAFEYARKVILRQIPKEKAMNSYYGHFYEFDSLKHAEPSWTHGIVPSSEGSQFGTDMGGIYPNYLIPIIDLLQQYPNHEDAKKWKQTLKDFTFGYLIPGCEANPFFLVPQVILNGEGPVWFSGTFHGTNCIYGYTAALALELEKVLEEPKLIQIAYGNLQWVAGLNAGITAENLKLGCVIFSTDVHKSVALPASMICHVGKRWAGTWFQTRGSICNGFSTGEQFKYDVEPKKENDGPFSLTDEDWIPHSAGWLTGLMRL